MNKRGFEFSFVWLFSILIGTIIIFLAIYTATKLIGSNEYEINTKTAADLRNILNPLGTSFEDSKSEKIELIKDTRVYVTCNSEKGSFGENRIQLSEKSSFKDWTEPGGDVSIENQYLFAENRIQGRTVYFIITPFEMPYKVADIMSAFSDEYCFVNTPDKIKKEIESLKGNVLPINFSSSPSKCDEKSISVCFQSNGCDINVRGTCSGQDCEGNLFKNGLVEKNNTQMYYSDGLLYGAIFSSPENYQCNVKRLARKLGYVSEVYSEKARLSATRCNTGLQSDAVLLSKLAENYKTLNDLKLIEAQADIINTKNTALGECNLY
ncbi:MAG: hypothetical protein AABW91_03090 [Nanoarchaeota archaeon]